MNIRLATIQDKRVLKQLLNNQLFTSDFYYICDDLDVDYSDFIRIYQSVMDFYGYKNPPIFTCVVNDYANFYGTRRTKNIVLLDLWVPNDFVNVQSDTNWGDFLFYAYRPELWSFEESFEDFKAKVLNGKDIAKLREPVQATIPCIFPSWLNGAYEIDKTFIDKFRGFTVFSDSNFNELKPLYLK